MPSEGRTPSPDEPHAFVKDWLDCCAVCGEGIENLAGDGVHGTAPASSPSDGTP